MAVIIKTLSQLPDPTWGIDGTTIWHEIAARSTIDGRAIEDHIDGAAVYHEIAKSSIDLNLNTTDRYWSSWKLPLSSEVLYTIYSGTQETPIKGLDKLGLNSDQQASVASDVNGSAVPGVLRTLELRNGLVKQTNLSAMRAQLCAIVGNYTQRPEGNVLRISGRVRAVRDDTFRILDDPIRNIAPSVFNGSDANIVPNARAVYEFTKEALPILLADKSRFKTVYKSEAGHTTEYSEQKNAIKKETVPHDAFIFTIPNSGTESNEWEAPQSGWFTCFGWLSEFSNGAVANYQRWVVLEGNINSSLPVNPSTNKRPANWCILQLQPFSPSPYISYVGFGVPVRKGLKMRIRTGFAVGASSGNYAMSNINTRSSMANHIANAFVGGIYSC